MAKDGAASATDIAELFDSKKIVWASSETRMSVGNIRLHLRVLRRLSMAVEDSSKPSYCNSALFYMDRNEEIWGRKGQQVALQESTKNLDSFQAGVS